MLIDATDETVESFCKPASSTQPVSDELSIIQRSGLPEHLAALTVRWWSPPWPCSWSRFVAAASFVVVAQHGGS